MEPFPNVSEETMILNLSRVQMTDSDLEHLTEPQRKQIQQLRLAYNSLALFPTSLCMFSSLEYLDMSNNALTVFPEDLLQLTTLKTLLAKNNQLDEASFPKRFGSMPIETLNFSGNRFKEIPNQFLELSRLKSLSLGGNRLKSIPVEIENLSRQVIKKKKSYFCEIINRDCLFFGALKYSLLYLLYISTKTHLVPGIIMIYLMPLYI